MQNYINKIKAKPEHVRKQYLIGFMAIAVLIVGGLWTYDMSFRFGSASSGEKIQEDIKPFALFGNTLKSTADKLTASASDSMKPETTEDTSNQKVIPLTVVD